MLDVLLTIDTEVSSRLPVGRRDFSQNISRDLDGYTSQGNFGIAHQLERLAAFNLRAVFFVEPLFSLVTGPEPLRRIIDMIQSHGHEVQLHLHTEWLSHLPELLDGRTGRSMKDFSEEDQTRFISQGLRILMDCGTNKISAFRAGNFGANADTLSALKKNKIDFDSSYNAAYLSRECALSAPYKLLQPTDLNGIQEIPVSCFQTSPSRIRHAQLCACSAAEMRSALLQAHAVGWTTFVLVSHSFELIKRDKQGRQPARPDRIVIRRFDSLLEFLAANPDKFRTVGFADLQTSKVRDDTPALPLNAGLHQTAWRMLEQAIRKMA